MGKRIAMAVAVFIAVCVMGVVIGSASGFTWGTINAGSLTLLTLISASFAFVATLALTDEIE